MGDVQLSAPAKNFHPLQAECVAPSIDELVIARNRLADEFARFDAKMQELAAANSMKLAVSAALAAEEIAKLGGQIQFVADGLHRGIAARLKLESRL